MEAVDPSKGRDYTREDDKGPAEILLRSKQGLYLSPAYDQGLANAHLIFGVASYLLQTRNGALLVAASETRFLVFSVPDRKLLLEEECRYIYSITLSPG
ncbi:unnamed protein product [Sphagnum balticum]